MEMALHKLASAPIVGALALVNQGPPAYAVGASLHSVAAPEAPCLGYDGSFEFDVPGLHDWWLVSEVGCQNPGVTWVVSSCDTGETLEVPILGTLSDGQPIDIREEVEALRETYSTQSDAPNVAQVFVDLKKLGSQPVLRADRIDPERWCNKESVKPGQGI